MYKYNCVTRALPGRGTLLAMQGDVDAKILRVWSGPQTFNEPL